MQVVAAVQSYQGQRGGQRATVAVKRGVQETCSTQEGAQLQRARRRRRVKAEIGRTKEEEKE